MEHREASFLPRSSLQTLLDILHSEGYQCVGPSVRDGAIVFGPVSRVEQLPAGFNDRQGPGEYRLEQRDEPRLFAWAVGPQALKPHLFAPREVMWRAERRADGGIRFVESQPAAAPTAVLGARACDLAALRLQDQHFLGGPFPDPYYGARRKKLFVVAVNCSHPAATCFCASTGDGPHAKDGFDLALTEFDDGFLVHVGSAAGARVADALPLHSAEPARLEAEREQEAASVDSQTRALPGRNLRSALFANLEHARWDDVAARCLACGNCTSVCPTCFCHAETESPALGSGESVHAREWDSCFTEGHAHIHGYKVRPHIRQRYRQWLTHKLGSWHEQYGRSGCVGCGRCIAWCPVGIDITVEATEICGKQSDE